MELTKMLLFAQEGGDAAAGAGGVVFGIIQLAIFIAFIAGMWTTFAKARKPGWAAIIPIYNIIVMLEIAGRPIWWVILFLIPCVNLVVAIILYIDIAKSFGKGVGFGIGLILVPFIFWPLLGFGDARYVGPAAAQS